MCVQRKGDSSFRKPVLAHFSALILYTCLRISMSSSGPSMSAPLREGERGIDNQPTSPVEDAAKGGRRFSLPPLSTQSKLSRQLSKRSSFIHEAAGGARRTSILGSTGFHRSLSSVGSKVAHYAALVVAENPLEQHKEYLEQLEVMKEEEEEDELLQSVEGVTGTTGLEKLLDLQLRAKEQERRQQVLDRWQAAGAKIISSAKLVLNADVLADKQAGGAERFAALVEIERMLHNNPHKRLLMRALELKRDSNLDSMLDLFVTELLLTGERIFDFFTPGEIGHHIVFFTFAMAFICFITFFYMVGAFPLYALDADPGIAACLAPDAPKGRSLFLHWIFPQGAKWCFKGSAWIMSAEYLQYWGARYGPLMKAQPGRWFTSWFVHQSFAHVTSNMALFLVVAYQCEEKYGFWRITLLFFMSALGGNFFSAAFENGCKTVEGASGGVFGMVGLFIADLILNFESVKRPLLRGILMLAFLLYFIISIATSSGTSSALSHVGGFVCGLFPAFLFLPNLKSEKWEQVLPIAGGFVTVGVYVALPLYFYKHVLPRLSCSA